MWSLASSSLQHEQPPELRTLPHLEGRCRSLEPPLERRRHARARPGCYLCQESGRLVEPVHDLEEDVALVGEQTRPDRLLERRVHSVSDRAELALVESSEDAVGIDDGRVRQRRLQVEEDAARHQAAMDPPQGVHDALERQSSQRVR